MLVQSEHKRSRMLSECTSANSRIAQVVWQKIYDGPTTEKARLAVVFSRQRGTARSRQLVDRSCCRAATLKVGWQKSIGYSVELGRVCSCTSSSNTLSLFRFRIKTNMYSAFHPSGVDK